MVSRTSIVAAACMFCAFTAVTGYDFDMEAIPKNNDDWLSLHGLYRAEITNMTAEGQEPLDLIIYGDSITESLRGTVLGKPWGPFQDHTDIFQKHFGNIRATTFGIGGDTTNNLLYRLRAGEAIEGLQTKVAAVLIGTNDLMAHAGELYLTEKVANTIFSGVIKNVDVIHESMPHAKLVVIAILPRGGLQLNANKTWVYDYALEKRFTPIIDSVNSKLQHYATNKDLPYMYADCGHVFMTNITDDSGVVKVGVNATMMPDALHPHSIGMDALMECLRPSLVQ